jgi:hypothetical protein
MLQKVLGERRLLQTVYFKAKSWKDLRQLSVSKTLILNGDTWHAPHLGFKNPWVYLNMVPLKQR